MRARVSRDRIFRTLDSCRIAKIIFLVEIKDMVKSLKKYKT